MTQLTRDSHVRGLEAGDADRAAMRSSCGEAADQPQLILQANSVARRSGGHDVFHVLLTSLCSGQRLGVVFFESKALVTLSYVRPRS